MTNEWYRNACDKGFHDNDERVPNKPWKATVVRWLDTVRRWLCKGGRPSPRQQLAWVALILTEWVEWQDDTLSGSAWFVTTGGKPCGLISELVDIWIRCVDTLGAMGCPEATALSLAVRIPDQVQDRIIYAFGVAAEASRRGAYDVYVGALGSVMSDCERRVTQTLVTARATGATDLPKDFDEALRLKTDYNRTRKRMHGKLA